MQYHTEYWQKLRQTYLISTKSFKANPLTFYRQNVLRLTLNILPTKRFKANPLTICRQKVKANPLTFYRQKINASL